MTVKNPARALAGTAAALVAALTLAACSATEPESTDLATVSPEAADSLLAEYGLEGLDAREIIDQLDATPLAERSTEFVASIRPDQVLISDTDREVSVPMPDDAFYVSLAPYIDTTHDCYYHSLTTCKGELGNVDVDVLVTDIATGEVIVDDAVTTFDNGFVGLWLPRGIDAEITISYDGKSATSELHTRSFDDATCVTTMQLA